METSKYPGAYFLQVPDTLGALQQLAARHRQNFHYPVIGITGSNGKTIVKEWLWQVLSDSHNIVRNPKSYNSQVGVPLSVWSMETQYDLAIFEAGISLPGEMEKLQSIIQPNIGVITNLGEAHSSGFQSQLHKAGEKIKLFAGANIVVFPSAYEPIVKSIHNLIGEKAALQQPVLFSWGKHEQDDLFIKEVTKSGASAEITALYKQELLKVTIPFSDDAAIENAITCMAVCLVLKIPVATIQNKLSRVAPVNMRLELKKGINGCTIINDSYSADISSLQMALDFLQQNAGPQSSTVILSDFFESKLPAADLYQQIARSLNNHKVSKLVGIGPAISKHIGSYLNQQQDDIQTRVYEHTEAFLEQFSQLQFRNETILVKGSRVFGFERIVKRLEEKVHQTTLEIDLKALAENIFNYKKRLPANVKLLAMVKAFAYGNGAAEIARVLQYNQADYLGVAYVDEGITLRNSGIQLPVMVLNVDENAFDAIINHNLEPVIYSARLLQSFASYLNQEGLKDWPVHLEIETGMNRLGFTLAQLKEAASILQQPEIRIQTLFSHLAASEDANEDAYTKQQFSIFMEADAWVSSLISYPYLKHIANTAAIKRHPYLVLDMVRLGIGMYGVEDDGAAGGETETVATLKTTIAQLKNLNAGETVGYNRKGIITKSSVLATVRIGYADGYPRHLGYGKGYMLVNGKKAPVTGSVCMDMTMIDVTGIENVQEGDEVIVFGKDLPLSRLAHWAATIPYEIMTGISERVPRVYYG